MVGIDALSQAGVYKTTYYPYKKITYFTWYDGPSATDDQRCVKMVSRKGYQYVPTSCDDKAHFVCMYEHAITQGEGFFLMSKLSMSKLEDRIPNTFKNMVLCLLTYLLRPLSL